MKYVVFLGDGMADDPQPPRGNKTPLELADTPTLDLIASQGKIGLALTAPPGMEPGSDVANLSILGYDPKKYHPGRAAIEAAALGLRLQPGEAAFRMNLVHLGGEEPNLTMADYSAGHPTKEEQTAALEAISREFDDPRIKVVPGVSFRNLLIISGFDGKPDLKPPHDHAGKKVADILPSGPGAATLLDLQVRGRRALAGLAINDARAKKGKPPINGVWFWGMGRAAAMPSFRDRHGKSGAVITGVDLVRGLGRLLDMEIVEVLGATGYVDTNFEGKAAAVLETLKRVDFVFLHVEAADEAGHEGNLDLKIKAITDFDHRAVRLVLEGLKQFNDYRVILLPDHETPVKERGHRGGAVPFAVADKAGLEGQGKITRPFSEKSARAEGSAPVDAPMLLETFLFV